MRGGKGGGNGKRGKEGEGKGEREKEKENLVKLGSGSFEGLEHFFFVVSVPLGDITIHERSGILGQTMSGETR